MIRGETLQHDDIPVSTSAGYGVPSVNVTTLGCPLTWNPHDGYDPSFPTFDNQMLEERKKVYGHLGYPFLSEERKSPCRAGNLAKLSSSIRN